MIVKMRDGIQYLEGNLSSLLLTQWFLCYQSEEFTTLGSIVVVNKTELSQPGYPDSCYSTLLWLTIKTNTKTLAHS